MDRKHRTIRIVEQEMDRNPEPFVNTDRTVNFTMLGEYAISIIEEEDGADLTEEQEEEVFEAVIDWWDDYPEKWQYNE